MDNIEYIKTLESATGYKLPLIDEQELSKLESKADINVKFFSLAKNKQLETNEPLPLVVQKAVDKVMRASREARIKELQLKVKKHHDDYHYYHTNMVDIIRNIANLERDILSVDNKTLSIQDHMAKACANPFWRYTGYDEIFDFVTFETTNNVILNYNDTKKAINMSLNFGRFKVTWNIKTNGIIVKGCGENLLVNSYQHPHINHSGNVCLGNAADSYKNYLTTGNIAGILEIFQIILTTYNAESPFVSIDKYYLMQNMDKIPDSDCVYNLASSDFWLYKDQLDTTYDARDEKTIDGQELVKVYTYVKMYSALNLRVGTKYYYKSKNNKYIEMKEDMIEDSTPF